MVSGLGHPVVRFACGKQCDGLLAAAGRAWTTGSTLRRHTTSWTAAANQRHGTICAVKLYQSKLVLCKGHTGALLAVDQRVPKGTCRAEAGQVSAHSPSCVWLKCVAVYA